MTHNITEKKLLIQQQLKHTIEQHNATARKKDELFNQVKELQGALKVLQELDHVHTDQPSDSEST